MEKKKPFTLITGSTSGIGLELARLFARDGINLILVARNVPALQRAARELRKMKVEVVAISADLFDAEVGFEIYRQVNLQNIVVDTLVNNAGQGHYGFFSKTDIHRELSLIQLNISSMLVLTKLFLKDMLRRGEGKILNVSCDISQKSGPPQIVYDACQSFIQHFTESLRTEVRDQGITVTELLPGITNTDFFRKANMDYSQVRLDRNGLADPVQVARDGFEALMRGDERVISGVPREMEAEWALG